MWAEVSFILTQFTHLTDEWRDGQFITMLQMHSCSMAKTSRSLSQTNRAALWAIFGKKDYKCEKHASNIALRCKRHFEMPNRLGVRINYHQCSNSIKCIYERRPI